MPISYAINVVKADGLSMSGHEGMVVQIINRPRAVDAHSPLFTSQPIEATAPAPV